MEVWRDAQPLDLGGAKPRTLLSALALSAGRPVSVDALLDLLWGDSAPPGATTTLQAYVSGLRKVLEPARERRSPATVLVTISPGYALRLPADAVDTQRFVTLVGEESRTGDSLLGTTRSAAQLRASAKGLEDALALWRGTPYSELGDAAAAMAERTRLEELRLVALERLAAVRLALGEHAPTAAELEQLTTAHPLRERLWALRAVALVRSGQQAEALAALGQVRALLADELGLDPGPELRGLQAMILTQDPSLAWAPPVSEGIPAASLPPAEPAASPATGWPMLGRDEELHRLVATLDRAVGGEVGYAVLTGEPGIGKSRLSGELTSLARARGITVIGARCSQDEGAPPLLPWRSVLAELDVGLDPAEQGEGGEFAVWQQIVRAVTTAAADRPLLLVLDDLHWADTATLRALRLLVETATGCRLMLVATWRDKPEPADALADVAESMARAHAVRVELTGLDAAAVAGVVEAVTAAAPSDADTGALRARTDGNPFFLVEYARLAGSSGDLAALLAEVDPPTAVQEVVARRLARLPERTRTVLGAASVIGRRLDLSVLAECTTYDEDALLDALDPAVASGLVREVGVGHVAFDHALVRDTVYTRLSATRRARQHATVARALERHPDTETETARHWLAAGPAHAAAAWRAASAAGEVAMRAHAHPEASALFASALHSLEQDPRAGARERYDVLVRQAVADRWAARWDQLAATAQEAVDLAEGLGDPLLAAEAATLTLRGALWQSAPHGQVHEELVGALRRSLAALPTEDSAIRCRCLVGLAGELYYGSGVEERRALVEESLAMARRLADPVVLLDVLLCGFNAVWVPGFEEERHALAEEALALSRRLGDAQAEVMAGVQTAIVLGELGRPEEMWPRQREALQGAERLRLTYALIVLHSLAIPWHAMAGEPDEGHRLLGIVTRLLAESALSQAQEAMAGNVCALSMWRDDVTLPEVLIEGLAQSTLPTGASLAFFLWQDGQHDRARRWLREEPPDLAPRSWFSKLNWGCAAAMATYTDDAALGADAYAQLAPYVGQSCVAGSGVASGPIDAYLALAARATGETALAARHADDALGIAEAWRIPLFARWFAEQRDRYDF